RAEPEPKLGPLVTNANIIGGAAEDLIGSSEARQRCKYTARAALTGEAVANSDSQRLTLNLNAQLTAATRGCSRRHRLSPGSHSCRRRRPLGAPPHTQPVGSPWHQNARRLKSSQSLRNICSSRGIQQAAAAKMCCKRAEHQSGHQPGAVA